MITICSNSEILCESINRDYEFEIRREATDMLTYDDYYEISNMNSYPPYVEFELNGEFAAWHGGRFSDQAKMFGLHRIGHVCYERDEERAEAQRISDELDRRLESFADLIHQSMEAL